ncbi:MAG: hypothetical protein CW338_07345 [Clostridiales bacterium]|nr:hypothetical protein [Clostridiales bacterium]
MNKLLRFERRKLFSRISLYVLLGVALLMVLFNILLPNVLTGLFEDMNNADDFLRTFGLSVNCTADIFIVKALNAGEVATILAVLIALIFTSDYFNHTVKNILARGYSRTQVFFSKLIVCEAVAVSMSILCMLFAWLMGTVLYEPSGMTFVQLLPVLGAQLIVTVALCAFFVFLSVLTKSVGGALAIGIVTVSFLPMLTQVIDLLLEDKDIALRLTDYNLFAFLSNLSKLPEDGASELVSGGMSGVFENLMSMTVPMKMINQDAVISLVWTVIMIILGWLLARKQEL